LFIEEMPVSGTLSKLAEMKEVSEEEGDPY